MDFDDDDGVGQPTGQALTSIDQEESGEEEEEDEEGVDDAASALTTTVTLFDNDHRVTSPSSGQQHNAHVTDVAYVVRKHYENFETIDWLKDLMRNRIRHRNLRAHRRDSWQKRLLFWFDTWSGWICVLLVGISAGRVRKNCHSLPC